MPPVSPVSAEIPKTRIPKGEHPRAAYMKKQYERRKEKAREAAAVSVQVRQEKAKQRRKTELAVAKEVKKIQLGQAAEVARVMMLPAVGLNFVYKIVTEKNEKGRVLKREHVMLKQPDEIAHALDCISNSSGRDEHDDALFYYVTVERPDYKAGEAILNRAIGKPAEKTEVTIKSFSLISLAQSRKDLPPLSLTPVEVLSVEAAALALPPPAEADEAAA